MPSFSSQEIDEDEDDKLAAVMESWSASIKRQAQLLMSLAISQKRNALLERRKDGSVVQRVMVSELTQMEKAFTRERKQRKVSQSGLRAWGIGVEVSTLACSRALVSSRLSSSAHRVCRPACSCRCKPSRPS